ncbi:hypothetical protein [Streptomyces spectabilis]|uniref:Uncharacterized protein n=1 Tax=Streptomyces spectabilis TaxID=68270 RepID=A0A7W8EYA0_STRST|nr:hypothetical protein [Streptomyces spectabilis]MBB5107894.1 hypothetical protein [Streptomyces spectabilis]
MHRAVGADVVRAVRVLAIGAVPVSLYGAQPLAGRRAGGSADAGDDP